MSLQMRKALGFYSAGTWLPLPHVSILLINDIAFLKIRSRLYLRHVSICRRSRRNLRHHWDSKIWLTIAVPCIHSSQGWRTVWLFANNLQHSTTGPNWATFSKDACIAILQNGSIQSCFHASVGQVRMPTMDPEAIGGMSTGLKSYPGRFCVPPYSQNSAVTARIWSTQTMSVAVRLQTAKRLCRYCFRAILVHCNMIT